MSNAYSTSAINAGPPSGAAGDRLSNLTQAIESIESRISSLMPAAQQPQVRPAQQVAAPPLAPVLPQGPVDHAPASPAPVAAPSPPAADIGQLKTTISRLTDQINAQASQAVMARSAAQAVPATASVPSGGAGTAGHGVQGSSLTSLAAQVAERKRALAREAELAESERQAARRDETARPRPSQPPRAAQADAHRSEAAKPRIVARPTPHHDAAALPRETPVEPRPDAPGNGGAMRDLSAKLDTIKTDLVGVKRSLSRSKPDDEALQQAREQAQEQARTRAEIERIASGIEALQAAPKFDAEGFDRLQDELSQLRQSMRADLRQTVRNEVAPAVEGAVAQTLRDRDGQMEAAVAQLSRGLDAIGHATAEASSLSAREVMPKVEALAGQFAELRGQVQDLPNTLTINRLEGKLREIAEAVEKVEAHESGPSHFELEGFAQIESRLDEITRALVAVGTGAEARAFDPSAIDLSGLERLEGRMSDLMGQIDQIGTAQAAAAQAAEQAAAAQAAAAEAAEIEQVSAQLATLSERLAEIERHAATSSRAAEQALDHAPNFSALETQLSALVTRLDDQAEADMSAHQLAALEGQLVQLAQAMDGMGRAQQAMQENVRDAIDRTDRREAPGIDFSPLEARLAEIEDRIDVAAGASSVPDLSPIEARLAGMEERIDARLEARLDARSTTPVDGQAQRQIALQAAQAAAAQVAEVMGGGADADLLAELSRDMHAVQEALVKGDHRNAETFDAVRRTLDAVGDRLATIEHGLSAGAGRVEAALASLSAMPAAPAPVMPAAAQLVAAPAASDQMPDAGSALEPDAPIEPNTGAGMLQDAPHGAPDIDDIVRRATARLNSSTAAQEPLGYAEPQVADLDVSNGETSTDVVAAARRAAQATRAMRAELDAVAGENGGGVNLSDAASGLVEKLKKPVIGLAAAVALLAAAFGSYWYVSKDEAPRPNKAAAIDTAVPGDVAARNMPATRDLPAVREVAPVPQRAEVVASAPASREPFEKPVVERAPRSERIGDLGGADVSGAGVPGVDDAFDPATLPDTRAAAPAAPAAPTAPAPIGRGAPDAAATPAPSPTTADGPAAAADAPATSERDVADAPVAIPIPAGITQAPLRVAAQKGDRLALNEIGTRLSEGRGVKKDLERAAAWFAKSAQRGFAPAEYALGSLHEKGLGVPRDIPRAVELYKSAAAKGNARAMHNLAVIQAMGALGQADMPNATRWFHEAASLGVKDSQFNLGILYGQGMGVPQNLAESYKWFSIAAGSGDADAAAKRDEVAAVMDAETLKRAKGLAAAWKAETPSASANSTAVPAAWGAPAPQRVAAASAKPKPAVMPVATVKRAQGLLNRIGYEIGRPDGKIGPRTRSALASFQRTWSLPATGKLDKATLNALEDANT